MSKCETCIHGRFDSVWGEWKCKALSIRVYNPEEKEDCDVYVKMNTQNGVIKRAQV